MKPSPPPSPEMPMNNEPLWTVQAMAAAMDAQARGPLTGAVQGVSIDSRTLVGGEAFFAIRGDKHDGHDFVHAALEAGAALAVIAGERATDFSQDLPLLLVGEVLDGMRALARQARARTSARIVAVTGSVGKTGTKEALRLALAAQGATHASLASYNNHWGVPLSLCRCPAAARFAIFEIGMNHAGEIEPLTRLVRPHVAIITAIAPVHLEFFASIEAIADAKSEIFAGLEPGGTAVLNGDSPQFGRLEQNAIRAGVGRVVRFGEQPSADARLLEWRSHGEGSQVRARIFGRELGYVLGAPGRHVALNSLAVLAAATCVGADIDAAADALSDLRSMRGRGGSLTVAVEDGTIMVVDESYNANPASMRAALALLGERKPSPRGRRIAVLGDMLELGTNGPELHRELANEIVTDGVDVVFCCGPLMRALWEALPASRRGSYAPSASELAPHVLAAARGGDIVMIKGSLGSCMGTIVKALESHFQRAPLPAVP
jgi:UDP-N-acetylmuramoyl-tripeptide--D-alanyl-D-alanine ligase